jgi:hypothetical protein
MAAAVLPLVLAACAHQPRASDASVRGIGYVRVADVLKVHPLYLQLSQLESAIDALNLKGATVAGSVPTGQQIAAETKTLDAELIRAQSRANAILRQKQANYAQREQAAIRAAIDAASAGTNGTQPAQQMQNVSAAQARAVTAQANQDFANYQKAVVAQDTAAVRAIDKQIEGRAAQEYAQKATQLQEGESQISLELSQRDAGKRLQIQTKLNNLAMDDATRNALRAQLQATNEQEAQAVDALRARDQRTLAAYRRQLNRSVAAQINTQTAAIHQQTRAKLEARRNEVSRQVASQLGGIAPAPIPKNLPAATRQKIAAIDRRFRTQFQADAQTTIAQYQAEKADLDARYAQIQGLSNAAAGPASAQLAQLQRERDGLYQKMVEQIKQDAGTVAARQGLQVVFANVAAAPGGIDLTKDVEKEIEGQTQ